MKLITKAIENAIKNAPLYSTDGQKDKKVFAKFFYGAYTWYAVEGNMMPDGDIEFFGYINDGYDTELGYFYLSALKSIKMWGYPCVERDRYFKPQMWSSIKAA